MFRHPRGAVAGVVLASALVACGGSVSQGGTDAGILHDAGSGGQGGGAGSAGQGGGAGVAGQAGAPAVDSGAVDVATACALFTDAYCSNRLKCEPFWAKWQWNSDPQRCQEMTGRWCRLSIEAHGSNTTPQWFADAAAKLKTMSCSDVLYTAARYQTYVFPPGTRAPGAFCVVGSQCASGVCQLQVGNPCGTCYDIHKAGSPCQTDSDCGVMYRCVGGSCGFGREIGQTCSAASPCMEGLSCTGGTCQITPPGGICPTGYECGGISNGEFCAGGTCQPTSLGQPGAPCGSYCAGGGYCSGTVCPALPVPAGGPCTATSDCERSTYCASGICTEVPDDCP